MMRQISLDTETTGLDPGEGHRMIELACVEIVDRRLTGVVRRWLLNPEREISAEAMQVHGLSLDKLRDQPHFRDIAAEFIEFVRDSELVIHNAAFDVAFLDAELERAGGWGRLADYCSVLDTLALARELHPGQRNNLDALCKRYTVLAGEQRGLHNALQDAQLLAHVYLAMTSGQTALHLHDEAGEYREQGALRNRRLQRDGLPRLPVLMPDREELEAHRARLACIQELSGGRCLWVDEEEKGRGSEG